MRDVRWFTFVVAGFALTLAGCGGTPEESERKAASGKPTVYSVNYPLHYFAQRIGGDDVDARFPVPADADPGWWTPDDETAAAYQSADLVMSNGAGYARWMQNYAFRIDQVIGTAAPFRDRYITIAEATVHSHGPEGKHAHEGVDPMTWLDPKQAIIQAGSVKEGLAGVVPEAESTFAKNLEALTADLEALDGAWAAVSEKLGDRPLLASHPVYNYLVRRYGWNLKNLHWEPGDMPPEEEWTSLEGLLETHPAKLILWEAPPLKETQAKLEALGVQTVIVYPLGNEPESGDYLTGMKANIERIAKGVMPHLRGVWDGSGWEDHWWPQACDERQRAAA